MDKQQILQIAHSNPQFAQAVDAMQQHMGDMPVTSEGIGELVKMLEFALSHPQAYPEIKRAAVADGYIDPEDLPDQFDQTVIISILAALYELQDRTQQQGYARGGLAMAAQRLQGAGRGGDTMLAHINPREAEMLHRAGGSGRINPHTGLPEYGFLSGLMKAVVPIAATFIAPYLAPMLGGSMLAAGAVTGAIGAGLTGGNPLQGAIFGGLGQGLGGALGSATNSGLNLNLSESAQNLLGAGLAGGAVGAATGKGFLPGMAQGAIGSYLGSELGGASGNEAVKAGGASFGNMLTAGYDPKTAAIGGGLSGLASSMGFRPPTGPAPKPSDMVLDAMRAAPGTTDFGTPSGLEMASQGELPTQPQIGSMNPAPAVGQGAAWTGEPTQVNMTPKPEGGLSSLLNDPKKLLMGATLLGSLSSAPQPVKAAVSSLSPQQQAYFNRPSITWDWNKMQSDAAARGLGLSQYMSQYWPQITGGAYNQTVPRYAHGGPLMQLARGAGSGRADTIDARLSDGEYVMDAETVALLGDGSTQEGARRLDEMRHNIRVQKGRALARGKFSPNAKSPLQYLKEAN